MRMSATKARVVLDLIRGKTVQQAGEILQFTERDAAEVVGKCLASAVANAMNNDGQTADELYVSACYADEGPTLKRWRPRARGRATRIRKRTSHVTVIVGPLSPSSWRSCGSRDVPGRRPHRARRPAPPPRPAAGGSPAAGATPKPRRCPTTGRGPREGWATSDDHGRGAGGRGHHGRGRRGRGQHGGCSLGARNAGPGGVGSRGVAEGPSAEIDQPTDDEDDEVDESAGAAEADADADASEDEDVDEDDTTEAGTDAPGPARRRTPDGSEGQSLRLPPRRHHRLEVPLVRRPQAVLRLRDRGLAHPQLHHDRDGARRHRPHRGRAHP